MIKKLIILSILLFTLGCVVEPDLEDPVHPDEPDAVTEATNATWNVTMATPKAPSEELKKLAEVEIKEFEGERLDSIIDVRDLSIKGPQTVDIDEYRLEIAGLVKNPDKYTYDEVLQNQKYSKVITIHCITGWSAKVFWEGVLLKDLFEAKPEANTVIFHAVDSYTSSLPLDYIVDNNIMLAYKINNLTLMPEQGYPFMVVAEDKYGYKWVKWVEKIELSDYSDYEGYWESRGYSNTADVE